MGLFCFLVLHKLGGLYQDWGSHVWVLLLQLGGQIMTLLTLQVNKTLHWSWVFFFKVHCNLGFCRGGDVVISHLILIWRLCFSIFFVDINTCIFIDFEIRDPILLKKIILMVRCIHTWMDALKNPTAFLLIDSIPLYLFHSALYWWGGTLYVSVDYLVRVHVKQALIDVDGTLLSGRQFLLQVVTCSQLHLLLRVKYTLVLSTEQQKLIPL